MKKYEVEIYYTGFCSFEITANDEDEAILKARELPINKDEFLSTIENWESADSATETIDEKSSKI